MTQLKISVKQTGSQIERTDLWLPNRWGGEVKDWELGISR